MDAAERQRTAPTRSPDRPSRAATPLAATQHGTEVTALVQLARLDSALTNGRGAADGGRREREALAARVSPDILDAYHRALRAGRQPALVPVEGSVCCGCHMRLHSSLAQSILRRGAAACPHCLRVVYDASRLTPAHS